MTNSSDSLRRLSLAELNAMLAAVVESTDWRALDARINRDSANWKRSVELAGIPKPLEVRQKISHALRGRQLPASTRLRISASLRDYHAFRRAFS
jgi:hypothetical protein